MPMTISNSKKPVDRSSELQDRVVKAAENNIPLSIQGGNTKAFYGHVSNNEILNLSEHQGVIAYEPTELVISAHAGTPLKEIEAILDDHHQMLAFEPPWFGDGATLGGTIACNLSGPRRAYSGAARDFVLGCKILNGRGEKLSFGGEVMKNVAGYDVSRLMTGAMGTLGVILDVSLKTVPKPEAELTLVQSLDFPEAIKKIHEWSQLPFPLSGTCIKNRKLYLRLSGTEKGIQSARTILGGEELDSADSFWHLIKEQQDEFFSNPKQESPLWRLSVASNTPELAINGDALYEWGGALRWIKSNDSVEKIRDAAASLQGHAIRFRGVSNGDAFHPLQDNLLKLHQNLKQAFDPEGILNPGRMYNSF